MLINFDARQVAPDQFPPPPPLDWYPVTIVADEVKETNEKKGKMLCLTLRISNGHPLATTEVVDQLNLENENAKTVQIAYKRLSAYCHVTGQHVLQNTAQLHHVPLQAKIGPQEKNAQYTQVYALRDAQGNEPGKQGQVTYPPQQPAQPVYAAPQVPSYNPQPQQAPIQQQHAPQAPQQQFQPSTVGFAPPNPTGGYAPSVPGTFQPAPVASYPGQPVPVASSPAPVMYPSNPAPAPVWNPGQPNATPPAWAQNK